MKPVDLAKLDVTTTKGEVFSGEDSAQLAWLVYRRFGRNHLEALDAWRRMLENRCPGADFSELVEAGRKMVREVPPLLHEQVKECHVRAASSIISSGLRDQVIAKAEAMLSEGLPYDDHAVDGDCFINPDDECSGYWVTCRIYVPRGGLWKEEP